MQTTFYLLKNKLVILGCLPTHQNKDQGFLFDVACWSLDEGMDRIQLIERLPDDIEGSILVPVITKEDKTHTHRSKFLGKCKLK